jgi:hypothetical protein
MKVVQMKEKEFGPLQLTSEHKNNIKQLGNKLQFKNGHQLSEGQIYSGQWNGQS